MKPDPTARFSDRVADYVRARPNYPREVLDVLAREVGFDAAWRVADVGAGTGLSARLFLDYGNPVTAVEPNGPMRDAMVRDLGDRPNFRATPGCSAAATSPALTTPTAGRCSMTSAGCSTRRRAAGR